MSKNRRYCYTLNNYTEEELTKLRNIDCEYHILGFEVGENNTPHIQGFIYFKNARSFNTTRKLLKRWHIEPCKGTIEQNITYCMKQGKFEEIGKKT